MAYQALYRTYRPQLFKDVVGQEVVVQTLQNAIEKDKISHAYLFSGPRGTGKTTIARIFAKALNCQSRMDQEPCDMCDSCMQIADGTSPDVIEIDGASNSGVEEIREIREKAKFLPSGTKYKIYIIDEVHMLTGAAFNALLKTLEEPPAHVVFILATTEAQKIPSTILSRCQRFEFKALSVNEIKDKLSSVCEAERVEATDEALMGIAEGAEGGLRDALSSLDQAISFGKDKVTLDEVNLVLGSLSNDKLIELASKFEEQDITGSLEIVHSLIDNGKEVDKIASGLLRFYHDLLLFKNVKQDSYSKFIYGKEEFRSLASKISDDRIYYYVEILSDVLNKFKTTQTPSLYLEIALIKMVNSCDMSLNYLERLNDLEQAVAALEVPEAVCGQGAGLSAEDEERINLNEIKLNKVIAELNRLELDKFVAKVKTLEEGNVSTGVVSSSHEVEEIKEDIAFVKANIQTLKSRLEEGVAPKNDVDLSGIEDKITRLEQRISAIPNVDIALINETSVLVDELEVRVSALEEKANKVVPEQGKLDIVIDLPKDDQATENLVVQETAKEEQIQDSISESKDEGCEQLSLDINEERPIEDNEHELARSIAQDILKMEKEHEQPKPIHPVQPSLFDFNEEESIDVKENELEDEAIEEDIEVKQQEEVVDLPEEEQEFIEEPQEDNDKLDEDNNIVEENIDSLQEESLEEAFDDEEDEEQEEVEVEPLCIEDEIKRLATVDLGADDYKQVEDWNGYEVYKPIYSTRAAIGIPFVVLVKGDEVRVSNTEETLQIAQKAYESASNNVEDAKQMEEESTLEEKTIVETEESFENKEVSEEQTDEEAVEEVEEQEEVCEEQKDSPNELVVENKPQYEEKIIVDKFNSYDIHFVEEILRDSKTESARNDLARIRNVWTVIGNYSEPEYKGIVSTLSKGQIVACGNKEFIIVFENAVLCNQAMALSFKQAAIKVLNVYLQTNLNYIALPKDVWLEKRTEYINQYNENKTREPRLSPISSPELFVITEEQEYKDPKDAVIDGMKHIFGSKVKIK